MGKTSNYEKRPRDYYPTPKAAVVPVINMLPRGGFTYCEPCAGDGRLVEHLEELLPEALCVLACDIEPQADWIIQKDGTTLRENDLDNCGAIITNPPFTWAVLKPMMERWISLRPTLLLLPADFMHNRRVAPFLEKAVWIKSIGRVKWIEDSKASGVENYAWYMFDKNKDVGTPTLFFGRT